MKPGSFVVFINYPKVLGSKSVKSYNFIPFVPVLNETILTINKIQKTEGENLVSFVEVDIIDQDGDRCCVNTRILREVELPKLPNFIEDIEFENV